VACGHFVLLWQWVLNNWDDNNIIKLLKNCYNALPAKGKVIIVEYILPEITDPDNLHDKFVFQLDLKMLAVLAVGARQRTEREIRQLALAAGFAQVNLVMEADSSSIIEMHKD
jgi:caffeic acid 3-O-methyltransferase